MRTQFASVENITVILINTIIIEQRKTAEHTNLKLIVFDLDVDFGK